MYRIIVSLQARREIRKIKSDYQEAINDAFKELKENPFAGKPLVQELVNRYSYKLGNYRIIYKINKKDKIIQVLTAGHRSVVYK